MKKRIECMVMFFMMLCVCVQTVQGYAHPPKLTIIVVIDQFAQHHIPKMYQHLRGGIRYLLDNGIVYNNAFHPNGLPVTGTGHANLVTGVSAQDHGIIGNDWPDGMGSKIKCGDDSSPDAAVLSPDGGTYDFGKSGRTVMVDGLTDQYVMQSQPECIMRSVSISLKDYAAVTTANKLGKAIWFDCKSGQFTSSRAYFDQLPDWVKRFNVKKGAHTVTEVAWNRLYPKKKHAYNFFNLTNYTYSKLGHGIVDTAIPVISDIDPANPYYLFERTPHANKLLVDLTKACIDEYINKRKHDRLLIWLCLSPLDLVGHDFGPESLEVVDMIYHIDKQCQELIRYGMKIVGKANLLVALSSDHGVCKIPELIPPAMNARRINPEEVMHVSNRFIAEKYSIENSIQSFMGNQFYCNMSGLDRLSPLDKYACLKDLKKSMHVPGIKRVWTFDELYNSSTQPNTIEDNMRKQLFPGRSGDLILQTYPYSIITEHTTGTTHETPYGYDTHVPLIIFQHRAFEARHVRQRVSTLQFANTMAEILGIPKPSASTAAVLPVLYDWELR